MVSGAVGVGKAVMHAFDRAIITIGGFVWIAGLIIGAYGYGYADALDAPYRPPPYVVVMVLAGFALWGVGLASERISAAVKRGGRHSL